MKTEEWKLKLMDYLYDEMNEEDRIAFEKEMKHNPELKQEYADLKGQQNIFQTLEDKAVQTPPFLGMYNNPKVSSNSTGLKWFAAIAASLLLFLVVGKITNLSVTQHEEGFSITFNQSTQVPADRVNGMIESAIAQYDQKISKEQKKQSLAIENQLANYKEDNKRIVNQYFEELSAQNSTMMHQYWKENNEQQKVYMRDLMTDFASYMETKREEDMDYLIAKMELIESDKDLFKVETGQYLNAMASNSNSVQNAY